jgi:TRAP-type uncharacterized transport system substrate-binding protein
MENITIETVNVQIEFKDPEKSKMIIQGKLDASEVVPGTKLDVVSKIPFVNAEIEQAVANFLKRLEFEISKYEKKESKVGEMNESRISSKDND